MMNVFFADFLYFSAFYADVGAGVAVKGSRGNIRACDITLFTPQLATCVTYQ